MRALFHWSEEKNQQLKQKRGVSFDDVVQACADERVLNNRRHQNQKDYPHQRTLIIEIDDYAYVVPYSD